MSSTAASAPFTWDDFVALEEDDLRELIDGELVEVEVPKAKHEAVVAKITQYVGVWADAGRGGRVLTSGYKIRVSDRRGVMPDVQFYARGMSEVKDRVGRVEKHLELNGAPSKRTPRR